MLNEVEVRSIGLSHGKRRIWIDGQQAIRGGFLPGKPYERHVDKIKCQLVLRLAETTPGTHIVSKKIKNEKVIPVIDINSDDLLKMFENQDMVRVVVQPGRITILPLASAN